MMLLLNTDDIPLLIMILPTPYNRHSKEILGGNFWLILILTRLQNSYYLDLLKDLVILPLDNIAIETVMSQCFTLVTACFRNAGKM